MGRFYETTFFDALDESSHGNGGVVGWQVLTSPPEINGQRIPYEQLVSDLGEKEPVDNLGLSVALQFVGDPSSPWIRLGPFRVADLHREPALVREPNQEARVRAQVERLLNDPFFVAETSPVQARSLAELAGLATTLAIVSLGDLPALVFIGEAVGLVVIRPLAAVSGALWEGAREEVVEFGADAAATLLGALRKRLGIKRRRSRRRTPPS